MYFTTWKSPAWCMEVEPKIAQQIEALFVHFQDDDDSKQKD